ncbi:hypothetical protein H8356DRAFT_1084792 [Neocallimastix lanati (nom. inval.)]|nr:hypothetical protein H8356DRAFT_1084792 [Neocallimastix sp. JGI-2020a]
MRFTSLLIVFASLSLNSNFGSNALPIPCLGSLIAGHAIANRVGGIIRGNANGNANIGGNIGDGKIEIGGKLNGQGSSSISVSSDSQTPCVNCSTCNKKNGNCSPSTPTKTLPENETPSKKPNSPCNNNSNSPSLPPKDVPFSIKDNNDNKY